MEDSRAHGREQATKGGLWPQRVLCSEQELVLSPVGPALQLWLPTLLAMGTGNWGAQRGRGTSALLVVDGGGRDRLKDGEMPVGGPASQMWAGLRAGVRGRGPRCPQGRLSMSHW